MHSIYAGLTALFLLCAAPAAMAGKPPVSLMQEVTRSIPLSPAATIEVSPDDSTSLVLAYSQPPSSIATARTHAESILSSIVRALVQRGFDPYAQKAVIFLSVEERGLTTATGRPGIRAYGIALYNYNSDAVEWRGR
jgi:hypothetical protein